MAGRTMDVSTSSFQPLNLQEIMMVPLAKQKMEDELLEATDKFGALSADVLDADSEKASNIINDFKRRANELSTEVLDQGVDRAQFHKLRQMRNEMNNEMATGFVGAAMKNKKAAMDYIKKMSEDKVAQAGWSPMQAQQWAIAQMKKFNKSGGTQNTDGTFNQFTGRSLATKVDEDKFLKEAVDSVAKEISPVALQMANIGGLPAFQEAWQDGKITTKDFNKVMEAILTKSMNNPQLLASLEQQAFFTGEKNALDMGHFDYPTVVDPITGKKKTVRRFVPGKSRYGRKAYGFGRAGSYRSVDVDTRILKDDVALKMYYQGGMDQEQVVQLVSFIDGELNEVNPDSLETTRDNLNLYGEEVKTLKLQADAMRSKLEAEGMTDEQIRNDFRYKQLQEKYIDSNTGYKNAQARMDNIYKNIDSQLSEDDKRIFEAKRVLDEKYGGDYVAALKGEFGKTISKKYLDEGNAKNEEHAAAMMFAKEMGINMDIKDRLRRDIIVFPMMFNAADERRTELTEEYLEANPQAESFTRLNGESTGKYSTFVGAWNKSQSDNFSVEGSTLAYNGGTLEENEDYQDLLVEGEIPEFKVEMTDGYDDKGNAFNNVIITTSKGSTSVQVIDNMNSSMKLKVANNLLKGDYAQRKMGEQMIADNSYMRSVKRSGMTWQKDGSFNVNIGGGNKATVNYVKDPQTGFFTATIDSPKGPIPIEIDGRSYIAGEKEMSRAIYQEVQEMNAARERIKAAK